MSLFIYLFLGYELVLPGLYKRPKCLEATWFLTGMKESAEKKSVAHVTRRDRLWDSLEHSQTRLGTCTAFQPEQTEEALIQEFG